VIIDTSALVATLEQEPEAERIVRTLASAPEPTLWAANLVEAGIVMQARRGDDGARDLDLLLAKLRVDIAAVTASQADIARKAFRRYGRGRHPANLNFGDCFAATNPIWRSTPQAVRRGSRSPRPLLYVLRTTSVASAEGLTYATDSHDMLCVHLRTTQCLNPASGICVNQEP